MANIIIALTEKIMNKCYYSHFFVDAASLMIIDFSQLFWDCSTNNFASVVQQHHHQQMTNYYQLILRCAPTIN